MLRRIFLTCCTFNMALAVPAQCLDFDGDALDDPVAFENQHDGSANELAYTYRASTTGANVRYEFGSAKEFPALADYDGDGLADFAAVGPNYDNNPSGDLVWRIKKSSENRAETDVLFGLVGDTYISGCSFDGDALADPAFVRSGALHVLKSTDSTEAVVELDESALKHFTCGDIDGDDNVDLIAQGVLQRNGSAQSYFLAWNPISGQKILDVQFGSGVRDIFAVDVDGDGIKEIAYRKDKNGNGRKLVVRLNGSALVYSLPKFQAVDFGRFVAGTTAEGMFLKIPLDDQFLVYPGLADLGSKTGIELFDTVTAVPSVNSSEVGPSFSSEAVCNVHDEPNDGRDGFLYKAVSETQQTVVILTQRSLKFRNMRIVKDGVVLEKVRRVTKGPGTRDFFRSKRMATSFPSYITLTMQSPDGLTHCVLIPDPTLRYD